jgi:hypothetical protein
MRTIASNIAEDTEQTLEVQVCNPYCISDGCAARVCAVMRSNRNITTRVVFQFDRDAVQ